jgi:CRISPR-associated protein Cas2
MAVMLYLVAYDITHRRRLARVAKILKRYGVRRQKSIFLCEITPEQLALLLVQLRTAIRPSTDKVRIYRLCETCCTMSALHVKTDPPYWLCY